MQDPAHPEKRRRHAVMNTDTNRTLPGSAQTLHQLIALRVAATPLSEGYRQAPRCNHPWSSWTTAFLKVKAFSPFFTIDNGRPGATTRRALGSMEVDVRGARRPDCVESGESA